MTRVRRRRRPSRDAVVIFRHWLLAIQDLRRRGSARLDPLPLPADLHGFRIDPGRDVGLVVDARLNVRTKWLNVGNHADGAIVSGDEQHPVRTAYVEPRHSILILPLGF